ncbi:hypothetical protein [Streptomyces sp. NPDC002221]|uniref:hypothetical protein n=1 Tax=Streptomyces sp. NPDC002221 TaxID=3364639 RepID=UPI00368E9147
MEQDLVYSCQGLLGIEHRQVLRLIDHGDLTVQYEGRVRLDEPDSIFAPRCDRPLPRRHRQGAPPA